MGFRDKHIPEWLNLFRDFVDSEDLFMSISRESLQQDTNIALDPDEHWEELLKVFTETADKYDDLQEIRRSVR